MLRSGEESNVRKKNPPSLVVIEIEGRRKRITFARFFYYTVRVILA